MTKAIIGGKVYNTETASFIGRIGSSGTNTGDLVTSQGVV